jgi:predicted nuclease of predicted toxin-antitoxin system
VVDECTGPHVVQWLRARGHDVLSIAEEMRGAGDGDILRFAVAAGATLITNDKDFGDRVFRDSEAHTGVVLLRLRDDIAAVKIAALERVIGNLDFLDGKSFVVATERTIRARP